MYWSDHAPPHFHAKYNGYEITADIESGVVRGQFPKRALRAVLDWLDLHKDELLENWSLAQQDEPLNPINPYGVAMMFLHTVEVRPLENYRLYIAFNNGEAGEVDLSQRLTGTMFSPLKEPALFATAYHHPELGTVAWANGADLAPEYLLDLLRAQTSKAA